MRIAQTLLHIVLIVMLYLLFVNFGSFAQTPREGPTPAPAPGPAQGASPAPAQGPTPGTKIVRVCIGDICEKNPDQVNLDCNLHTQIHLTLIYKRQDMFVGASITILNLNL
jgi:hypothetical protein